MTKNVAVVGNGYWGRNLIRNFHELRALGGICDESPLAEASAREQYPDIPFHREYAGVLRDGAISAVVLATPAAMHFEMAKRALLAGKDVFVEKPLSLAVVEGAQLVEIAEREGRVLMVGHILRYHPAVLKLRQLVAAGELGQIRYLYSNRLNIGKIRSEENILWSFAPHDISVMLGLLDEEPVEVSCQGGGYLSAGVADVTVSNFVFASGVRAHIFVSWLHPFKEQRLVVVGSEKMAVFDDTAADKLVLYPHRVEWKNRIPTAVKAEGHAVALDTFEPLKRECRAFLDALVSRTAPVTDGREGLRVLKVLNACQRSLEGRPLQAAPKNNARPAATEPAPRSWFAHESATVGEGAEIGPDTKIWHYSHVMKGARIGARCSFGQNCHIAAGAVIGDNVKVQNNVSVYAGAVIENDVFLGPSCVFTNVTNPRAEIGRHSLYERTVLRRGATVGANATIVCGTELGRYAFIGAGSVVTRDVPDYALMAGNPARQSGWMSRHGQRLGQPDRDGIMVCPESGYRYREIQHGVLRCLDLDEDASLPEGASFADRTYDEYKALANCQCIGT